MDEGAPGAYRESHAVTVGGRPSTPMAVPWTDREPGYFALRSEVGRLYERARRRKGLVLLGALLTAGAAVLFTLRAPRRYVAQLSVQVTEVVEFHLPRSSWTDRELR